MNSSTVSPANDLTRDDRRLVDACLASELGAWSALYQRFHIPLTASIKTFLGKSCTDLTLVDEIAARVWYALIRGEFRLLASFDPERGCRLATFLSAIARGEARALLRSERRRKKRELAVSVPEGNDGIGAAIQDFTATEGEFLQLLSPAELAFYQRVLLAVDSQNSFEDDYTEENSWQLRHRVREKLVAFLGDE